MSDLPDLKIKALVSLPATILDGTGIDVVKQSGTYQFNLAYDDFAPPVPSIADPTHQNLLLWNDLTGSYALAPVSLIGSGGGGGTGPAGPAGPPGAAGEKWFTGSGNPATISGAINGDWYLNSTNGDYWELASGTWALRGNLAGPQGPTGPAGPTGSGAGDVNGPASAIDNDIVVFSGTSGKTIKESGVQFSALQPKDATLTALAGLDGTNGLVEQTGVDIFAKRALGVGASTSIPTRADADARYAPVSSVATPAPLTRTSDTNVTLTLGGTPATALLQATSITVGWAGTLAASRGGFGVDASTANGVPLFAAGVPAFTATTGTGSMVRAVAPDLTGGDAIAKTQTAGDSSTKIATTAFVGTALSNIADSAAWTAYTPTLTTAGNASPGLTAGAKYKRVGKTVFVTMTITYSASGNGTAAGNVTASLPPFAAVSAAVWAAKEINATGNMCVGIVFAAATTVVINRYDANAYPGGNNAIIIISGAYEGA